MVTGMGNWIWAVVGGIVGVFMVLLGLAIRRPRENDEDIGDAWDDFWGSVENEF